SKSFCGCKKDGDCRGGEVCVAASGTGPCPSGAVDCACHTGRCHEASAVHPSDCAGGACCTYTCSSRGQCCSARDCLQANPGAQPLSTCQSAASARATQVCSG